MIPNRDYYKDKSGKLTEDPEQFAAQVAVKGVLLDDRIAKRYGIEDSLVSIDEPAAVRKVMAPKPEKEAEPEAEKLEAAEAAPEAASPEVEKPKPEATKIAAKKGAKKNVKVR